MPILPFTSLDDGYEPATPELNEEEGVLDISHPSDCILQEESKIIAETLVLRCSLRPIPLQNKAIHVQLIAEGEVLENAPLYEDESVAYGYGWESESSGWKGIALDYAGIGRGVYAGETFIFYGNRLPFGEMILKNPLYLKPFNCEVGNYQERMTSLSSGQVLRSPPGALDTQFLRGYGGYYKPGIALEDIQQVYYTITSTHRQTRVRLVNSTTLQEQHTSPPHGGQAFNYQVQFIPTLLEEEYLSLPGALASGYAHLSVTSELGITSFSSFLCEPIPGLPNLVNVYFRAKST